MWFEKGEKKGLTNDQLLGLLKESSNQIVLLEGPTGCGKSRMLQALQREAGKRMMILPEDRFVSSLMADVSGEGGQPFAALIDGCEVVCAEDIDLLEGRTATQQEAAKCLSAAAQGALVILTGIGLRLRVGGLIQALESPARLFEYREE